MRKSISNVVAGGLITSATVIGVDAMTNTAVAMPMETQQQRDFTFEFDNNAQTCCLDPGGGSNFIFDGFDANLGTLISVALAVSVTGLTNNTVAQTCCYEPTNVTGFGGQIGGQDLTREFVTGLGRGANTADLDPQQFLKDLVTVALDFNILFDDTVIPINEQKGGVTLSYVYQPAPVPLPGTAALLAPALLGLYGAARRRREKAE